MSTAKRAIIDVDIHHNAPNVKAIFPYLPKEYSDRISEWGLLLPSYPYMNGGKGGRRVDANPPNGGAPGTDLDFMREHYLDPFHVEYGILTGEFYSLGSHPDAHYAAALASAYNDYTRDHWLDKDDRLRGSITIPKQHPLLAAKEIDRVGDDRRFVQVLVPGGSEKPYGNAIYEPIFEACVRHNLVFTIHIGNEGQGINPSPTGAGHVTHYIESRASRTQTMMAHMASLLFSGVFEKYPTLKVVMQEAGVMWIAPYLWKLDQDWKGLRVQTPWVKKPPSDYYRSNMYVSSQPIELTPDPALFVPMLDALYAKECLLFASDYPHWDFDSPRLAFPKLDASYADSIFYRNAANLYGLQPRTPDRT
ncbi:amidohydrolase family protein [Paenibacillus hodogayensis]|uniref:Amidohydrolase family protein n=1 Tax=Paenibacillus hodogayensis TaxID=279208 RepID=A0ABV5W2L5_9BACL